MSSGTGVTSGIRKTRKAWDEPGHAHFLTYSCYRRLPLLSRDRTRRWVIDAMEATRRELDVALWAYVIMPEHVHLLLCPRRARYEMRRIPAALKRSVATAVKAFLLERGEREWLARLTARYPTREVFRFWQPGGGFDHNIFREKDRRGGGRVHPREPGSSRAGSASDRLAMVERAILGR